jgi:hypothetical protein
MDQSAMAMYNQYMSMQQNQQQHHQQQQHQMGYSMQSASAIQTPLPNHSQSVSTLGSVYPSSGGPSTGGGPIPSYLGVSPSTLVSELENGTGVDGSINRAKWLESEDAALRNAVAVHGAKNWRIIAAEIPSRSDVQCLHRWQKVLRPGLVKGPWTFEEDEKVKQLVGLYGTKRWSEISSHLEGRLGKQVSYLFI